MRAVGQVIDMYSTMVTFAFSSPRAISGSGPAFSTSAISTLPCDSGSSARRRSLQSGKCEAAGGYRGTAKQVASGRERELNIKTPMLKRVNSVAMSVTCRNGDDKRRAFGFLKQS